MSANTLPPAADTRKVIERLRMSIAAALVACIAAFDASVAIAQVDPDLLVELPLDEGVGLIASDASGMGNDGTLVNGAVYEASTGDGSPFAVRFDGVDDRIDLGALDVDGSGLTLAAWFNADSFPGPSNDPRLISKATGTGSADHVFMLGTIQSGSAIRLRARVRVGGSTTTLIASSGDLVTGAWQHAAVTYDGATLRLYLDGSEVGSTALSGAMDVAPSVAVAVGDQPAGAGARPFDGLIDDVRILQRPLSRSELEAVVSGNQPPVAVDDGYATSEDIALVVGAAAGVLANDTDADLDALQAVLESDVSNGVLSLNPDGSFEYTPNPNFSGVDSFAYRADDGGLESDPATVTLTVDALNDAPVAVDDAYQTLPDTPVTIVAAAGVLANDTDPDLDALQAVLESDVSNGVLSLNADGSFDYMPNLGFSGTDSFTYRANDGQVSSNPATVTIAVGQPPTAVDDGYAMDEDVTLAVPAGAGVLANDVDNTLPDDLTARQLTAPANGTLTSFAGDGSFTYVPNANFNGTDSFLYEAVDTGSGTASQATVTLTINAVNDAPVAADDNYGTLSNAALVADAANGVLANDTDADLDALQAVLVSDVSNGVLNLNPDGSFDYTPNLDFIGTDTFTYRATDATLDSNLATVAIMVTGSSDPDLLVQLPLDEGVGVIASDASGMGNDGTLVNGAVYEASTGDGSPFAVRFDGVDDRIDLGALDVDGSGLTLAAWFNADSFPGPSNDPRLISKATGTGSADHVFMLGTIQSGSAIRLRARVRVGGSTTTLIASSGDLVTGAWQHAAVTYDGATLRLYLDGSEVGSTALSGAMDVAPSVAVAVGDQPAGAGARPFDGLIDDVRILQRPLSRSELEAVVSGNQPPVAVDDGYATSEDIALVVGAAGGVLANDTDADLDVLQAMLESDVSNGTLSLNADGSFEYTPNPNFSGVDSFTYRADDGGLESNPATVTLTVDALNDAPVAVDDAYQTLPDTPVTIVAAAGVLANDTDPDLDALQAVLESDVSNGVLSLNADGSFDYMPNLGFSGTDSFTYRANDGQVSSNPATVTIAVGQPPTAVDDGYAMDEDVTLAVPAGAGVLANDVDNTLPDDLTARQLTAPANGTLTSFAGDGSFTYVPNANFNGTDSFLYEAVDGGSGTASQATVTLTINAVNDAPVAADDNYGTLSNAALVADAANGVLANDTDADLDALQAVLVSDVSNGVLNLNPDGSFDYTPNLDFVGTDTFTYRATDATLDSNLATVTIAVDDQNTPPQIVTGTIDFAKQIIADTVDETHAVMAADFTGNGHLDVVATDYIDGIVHWYESDGLGGYTPRVVDPSLEGAYPVHVADVDGDEDIDVLAGGYLGDTFAWYENDGLGGFTRRDIDNTTDGPHSIVTGDLDKDGDIDLVTTSQDAGNVAWYENDGANTFVLNLIDTTADGAKRAELADIDGDGDLDVISASFFATEVAWHENDGSQGFTKRVIDSSVNGAYYVFPADVDGDGNVDVLSASQLDNTIALYRNQGAGSFTFQPIDSGAIGARTVIAADIDDDGDLDAISTSVNNDSVAWYENDGNGAFTKKGVLVSDGAYGVFAADMNADGNLDILSAGRDDYTVALHLQVRAHLASVPTGGTLVIDTTLLQTVDAEDGPAQLTYRLTSATAFGEVLVGGDPIAEGETFTQADIDNGIVSYVHNGIVSGSDSFSFTVADNGAGGMSPLLGTFTVSIGESIVELPLDEGSGTIAGDVSGAGNDGILVNGPLFEADTGDGSAFAVRFDGVDDLIDLGTLDVSGAGLTLAARFNADSFPGPSSDPRIIAKASGTEADDHVFMLGTIQSGAAVRLRGRVRVGGTTTTLVASTGDLATGVWQHATLTYDGATLRMYLNGTEVGLSPLAGAVDADPTMPVAVGNQPPGAGARAFDGLIDDVRILDRALGAAEVASLATPDSINRAPVASNTSVTTFENLPVGITLQALDLDADSLTYSLVPGSLTGTLSGTAPNLTYTPAVDFVGTESFDFDVDDGNGGTDTGTVDITVLPFETEPPTSPANVAAQALSDSQILVTWTASSDNVGVAGYRVMRDGLEVGGIDPTVTEYTDTGLPPATEYLYTVVAFDANGNESLPSAPAVATTLVQSVDPTLVAGYAFEESGDAVFDNSGNGHHGSLTGSVARTSDGYFDNALDFQTGHVDLGNLDIYGSGMSIAMWFNADTFAQEDARLISKATGVATNEHWWMISTIGSDNRLRFRLKTNSGTTETLISTGPSLQPGVWTHVAATYDGATMRLYQNGVEVGSLAHGGDVATGPNVAASIGDNPGSGTRAFDGRIDEVWIFARALSAQEIGKLMITPSTPDTTSPLAPSELMGQAISTAAIELHWSAASDNIAVVEYNIRRDGILVETSSQTPFTDQGLAASTQYSYSVSAIDAAGNESADSAPVAVTTLDNDNDQWWNPSWTYRLPIVVDPLSIRRSDKPVEVTLDFTALLTGLGAAGALDLDSLRVVEVNAAGQVIDEGVSFQFDPASDFDAVTNAVGELVLISGGVTPGTARRFYHLYFDIIGAGFTPAVVAPQVTLVDNVRDEGLDSYEITTGQGTYYYQKQAGGFSSLLDAQGKDWIDYHPTGGSAGNYRGIPNLVYPEGHFHPGAMSATSTIVRQGPLLTEIRSETTDGLWASTWTIFPSYARLTVEQADHDYWFLYEGTPGGALEPGSDFVVRSSGAQSLAADAWSGDLGTDEWAYFGDPVVDRALFAASHEDDSQVDSYYELDGNMTVFGFGREGTNSYLSTVPGQFTIGFLEDPTFETAAEAIVSAYKPLAVVAGTPVQQGTVVQVPAAPQGLVAAPPSHDQVELSWDAASDNVGIAEYQILRDGVLIATASATTYLDVGLTESTTYTYAVVAIDVQGNASAPSVVVQVTTPLNEGPITFWYGSQQTFGALGQPQVWINVLGNIADLDGVGAASYSLNGRPPVSLSLGPDNLRLAGDGDFNIDLGFDELDIGTNEIFITASDLLGNEAVAAATVDYPGGVIWPLPYSIDWSAVASIDQVAQVVDGRWGLDAGGIRVLEFGYDRIVAIGDIAWTDYEITVPITVHGRNPACDHGQILPTCSGYPPGVGLIARWQGHYAWDALRPRYGWYPLGALGWFRFSQPGDRGYFNMIGGDDGRGLGATSYTSLPFGTPYIFKLRVETVGGQHQYSFKAWPQTDAEPAQWLLVASTAIGELASGSALLLAHHVDATFGNVEIVPIGAP